MSNVIPFETPLQLVMAAVRKYSPRNLADPPRSFAGQTLPLEDQFQKEFYRSFYTIVDGQAIISPEYVALGGKGGGTIDFLVPAKKGGVELLRDRSNLKEHMSRFQQGGQYHDFLRTKVMEDYLVLDFNHLHPTRATPR